MRLRNLTRRREIGANCYLIEHGDQRIVLDSGMHPKEAGFDALPDYGPLPHDAANAIFVTHAHHDHIGSLPVLQRRQPNAPVLMTEFTGEVGSAMLHNSVNVMTSQREELGITEYPFFSHRELDEIRAQWIYRDTGGAFEVPDTDFTATLHDAGHIVGSAGVTLRQNGSTLFYTGDVNFEPQTISMAADFPTEGVDVLMLETTRGTHQRPEGYSRKGEKERLAALIRGTHEAGGSVLIPVFALGKTQEVMLMLHELHQEGLIPDLPLHIGGLATKITLLYDHYASRTRRNYSGFRLLQDIDIFVAPQGRRRGVAYQPGAIFALSSGMMSEGTTSNQFAQTFLDNPRNSIAFVGYTDPDSPGYRVRTAQPGEMIRLAEKAPQVALRCRREEFDLSAHATREALAGYAEKLRPSKIVLVHGEVPAQEWFADRFRDTLPETEIIRPEPHTPIDLW
jgi:Cft2 family RNA processing exonuclease